MFNFTETAIPTLAGDIRNVVKATDTALIMQAQMLTSAIEVTQTSNIPINASQRVINEIVDAVNGLVGARESTRKSIASMTVIGRQSKHREMMDGCPHGLPHIDQANDTKLSA